jgi:hypothetical protein
MEAAAGATAVTKIRHIVRKSDRMRCSVVQKMDLAAGGAERRED